jgi:threonine dehydrogenase-like Zn-dependent dehydrogenase
VNAVKFTGHIGVVGVFVPQDPNGKEKLQRRGQMAFDFGMFWFKGQKMGTGQCPVKAYNRFLSRLIEQEKVKPSWIVSHELPLEQAPEAYKNFDARKDGWTKVTLKPNG